ncbi:hypothetical protein SLE2022_162270 [Rubroshorea leprosula]
MRTLGFTEDWIRLIMNCVSSVTYKVLLNGLEAGRVTLTRGLRQGDPLSPYLFILCAEGLTSMLKEAEWRRLLHGVRICGQAPKISHCSLQMIASCSYEQRRQKLITSWIFSDGMKGPLVK